MKDLVEGERDMASSRQNSNDVPGNAVQSQANFTKWLCGIGEAITRVDGGIGTKIEEGTFLLGITIKAPVDQGADWLAVVRADVEGVRVVAFHSADTLTDVIKGACNRYTYNKLKWKDDEYA